ncbi:MAG: hypothetical protein ACK4Q5_16950 [Saprospiraceae bacterium]
MNYEQITALLERYWEGETSLEEERALKAYFAQPNVDARLQKFAPLFGAIRAEQSVQMIDSQKVVPMRASLGGRIFRYSAAASIALLLAAGTWWYAHPPQPKVDVATQEDTFDDPEQAAAEIKAALALVSSKMRKGKKEAAKGLQKMEAVDKFIIKPKPSKKVN